VVVGLAGSLAAGETWARFRGDNGGGTVAAGLAAEWSPQTVAWKTTLPARGHSSPVIAGGKVFTTAADQQSGRGHVLCLDAASGAMLWNRERPGKAFRQHADNSYASATPAVDGERVYVAWFTPAGSTLEAFDHAGTPVWSVDLGGFTATHGGGASPIVVADLVVLAFEQDGPGASYVLAVDARTGKQRWRLPRTTGKMACSTPCLFEPAGAAPQLLCSSSTHGLYAVDLATGKPQWDVVDAFKERCVGSPVICGGVVIAAAGSGNGGKQLVAVRPPAKAGEKPQIAWQAVRGIPYVPCPVGRGDLAFLLNDDGSLACVRAASGEEVWRQRLDVGGFYASPVLAGDRLYLVSKRGDLLVLAASEQFKIHARASLGEGSFATPAIADGRLYVRTFTALVAIGK